MLSLCDRVPAGNWRPTSEGYLVAMPRIARTGIQLYTGDEVGRPDMERVRVYRADKEVFSQGTLKSLTHRPLTNDHPPELVTAKNWKKYAIGISGDELLRDGDYLRTPMLLMDEAAIRDVDEGKREISVGYTCDLDWTPGKTKDGEEFDARQTNIRANHIALVKSARGGDKLRFGDADDDEDEDDEIIVRVVSEEEDDEEEPEEEDEEDEDKKKKFRKFKKDEFNPSQPRAPAGTEHGGEWVSRGTSGAGEPPELPIAHREAPGGPTRGDLAGTAVPFASRQEAKAYLKKQQRAWKRGRVEEHTHITHFPRTGLTGWLPSALGGSRKVKTRKYIVRPAHDAMTVDNKTCPHCGASMDDDATTCPECNYEMADAAIVKDGESKMKTMTIDGVSCEMPPMTAQIVERAFAAKDQKIKDLQKLVDEFPPEDEKKKKKMEEDAATIAAKDVKIAELTQKLKDSEVTPQMLDARVITRAGLITKAKTVLPTVTVDGRSDNDIRKQVVDHKLREVAKDYTEHQLVAAFDAITADAPSQANARMADAFSQPQLPLNVPQTKSYEDHNKYLADAWKKPN